MGNYSEVALVRSMSWLMDAQGTIAHNLANVDTAGYKRRASVAEPGARKFQTMLQEQLPTVTYKDFADWQQGNSRQTGNPFDVSLDGPSFFRVRDDQGNVFYTREGAMRLDDKARLVSARDGARFLDANNQEIVLQTETGVPNEISISGAGAVNDSADGRNFGNLGVWQIPDQGKLQSVGKGRYLDSSKQAATTAAGNPVRQGSIESSNVDSLQEMVRMITVQRSFATAQKALSSVGRMQETLASDILRS